MVSLPRNWQSVGTFSTARQAWLAGLVIALLSLCANAAEVRDGQLIDSFETLEPNWRIAHLSDRGRLVNQIRANLADDQNRCERFYWKVGSGGSALRLELPLAPAVVVDDMQASLAIRSNSGGWRLGLGLVFPEVKDPATGSAATVVIQGTPSPAAAGFQTVTVRLSEAEIREKIVLLRARLRTTIDPRDVRVDRVVLIGTLDPGEPVLELDDLSVSPFVPVDGGEMAESTETAPPARGRTGQIEFRLDRLYVDGRPILPRIVPHHGEPLTEIRATGANVVWIPRWDDTRLLDAIQRQGLWATAAPPVPVTQTGEALDRASAGLLPFDATTSPILFWMLGTRLKSGHREIVESWSAQVEEADRTFRRPLAAELAEDERYYSRYLGLIGTSRHMIGSSLGLDDYARWLEERRAQSRPGAAMWTWIQVEPAPALAALPSAPETLTVEPEQIRQQVYAALMAGYRGVGYWTTKPFTPDDAVSRERQIAIALLNQELTLLEPWLATSGSASAAEVLADGHAVPGSLFSSRSAGKPESDVASPAKPEGLETAVLRTDHGTLLLVRVSERNSQFCPGKLAAQDIHLLVPGGDETSLAVELTPTRVSFEPRKERATGGLKIHLREVDETAAILITSNQQVVDQIRSQVAEQAQPCGEAWVELARLKLARVMAVDNDLRRGGGPNPETSSVLAVARKLVAEAQAALNRSDWHAARTGSRQALRLVRSVQQAHWELAVKELTSPVASPYTMSFDSLPAHWRLIERLGRHRPRGETNLLPSGNFEDADSLLPAGWDHDQSDVEGVAAASELYPEGYRSAYSLRMRAGLKPGAQPIHSLSSPAITWTSPGMPVYAGQLVHISGRAKVPQSLQGGIDGLTIHDSLLGKAGAIRLHAEQDWRRFELLREVPASQELRITISLSGFGEVYLDDLQVVPHEPETQVEPASREVAEPSRGDSPFSLDWLKLSRKRAK
jgi:hypothetical protein